MVKDGCTLTIMVKGVRCYNKTLLMDTLRLAPAYKQLRRSHVGISCTLVEKQYKHRHVSMYKHSATAV
jgi:hypothetical protein